MVKHYSISGGRSVKTLIGLNGAWSGINPLFLLILIRDQAKLNFVSVMSSS